MSDRVRSDEHSSGYAHGCALSLTLEDEGRPRPRRPSKACPTIKILLSSEPGETRHGDGAQPGRAHPSLVRRVCYTPRGIQILARACGLLRFSCGNPKLSRRDAGDPLEVKGKIAVVREADAARHLHQTELAICPQEVLRSFNAARDHILVRRQPDGRLELAHKVIGAERNDGSHLLQCQIGAEIFHDVLDERAELPARKYAGNRGRQPMRTPDMTDQLNR